MRSIFDITRDGLSAINTAADQLAKLQDQLATGRALRVPSDDPAATARAIGEHAELSTIAAYTQSADAAAARQAAADSIMSDMIDKLTAALTTATSAAGTTATPATRDAAAAQLKGLREALAGDINSKFQGSYLFSGSKTDQAAYVLVGSAWTYQGDNSEVLTSIDSGRQVNQSWDGQSILQGSASQDVLTVIDNLTAAVQAGDNAGITAGIAALQDAFKRATAAQSRLGADEQSVTDAQGRLSDLRLATDTRRSKDEDVNMADAAARMNQAQVAYRAAIGAVSMSNQASLIDYLK
jgi:flagellar hook-associated protein 3 FlgL